MWAFNEEIVARAIFECRTPVISAVGHETDFTIADFVADLRAPTPSAAAELAVYDYRSVLEAAGSLRERLHRAMWGKTELFRERLLGYQTKLSYVSPQNRLREDRQRMISLEEALETAMDLKIKEERQRLSVYLERFSGLSPLKKLNQGYSYVANEKGKTVTSVDGIKEKDRLFISVTDGTIETEVSSIRKETEQYGR